MPKTNLLFIILIITVCSCIEQTYTKVLGTYSNAEGLKLELKIDQNFVLNEKDHEPIKGKYETSGKYVILSSDATDSKYTFEINGSMLNGTKQIRNWRLTKEME